MIEHQFALLIISVFSIYVRKSIRVNTMNRISYDNNLYYNFYNNNNNSNNNNNGLLELFRSY